MHDFAEKQVLGAENSLLLCLPISSSISCVQKAIFEMTYSVFPESYRKLCPFPKVSILRRLVILTWLMYTQHRAILQEKNWLNTRKIFENKFFELSIPHTLYA